MVVVTVSSHWRKVPARLDCGCEVLLSVAQVKVRAKGRRVAVGCGEHRRVARVARVLSPA